MDSENQPYIAVVLDYASDDLRDKMLKRFFEKLNYSSNLALIEFVNPSSEGKQFISIEPIAPGSLQGIIDRDTLPISIPQVTEMSNVRRPI